MELEDLELEVAVVPEVHLCEVGEVQVAEQGDREEILQEGEEEQELEIVLEVAEELQIVLELETLAVLEDP